MDIISLVIVLIVVGFILWLINTYLPLQPPFKQIINVVVIIAIVLWLLNSFGLLHEHIHIG